MASNCIEETGRTLDINNQGIVKYLCTIEEERNNLETIIQKQYQERKKIEAEIEKLTYKLCLINKSLSMRIKAKNNYDKTIDEIKSHYEKLVISSSTLREIVEKTQQELDDIMNKKIGTGGPSGEEIKMLYVKQNGSPDPDHCPCSYVSETPTKENKKSITSSPEFSNKPSSSAPPNSPTSESSSRKRSLNQDKDETDDKEEFEFPAVYEQEDLLEPDRPNLAETSPPKIELPEQFVNPPQKDENQSQTEQPNMSSADQPITDGRSENLTNKRRVSADIIEDEKEIASISAENDASSKDVIEPSTAIVPDNISGNVAESSGTVCDVIGGDENSFPKFSKDAAKTRQSTNLLINRLKVTLNQLHEDIKPKRKADSSIASPHQLEKKNLPEVNSVESIVNKSKKIEKRSVSDVLNTRSGLT